MVIHRHILQDDKKQPGSSVIIYLILLGFLVFSPFSSVLIMDMLGSPISLPEILFLPFVYLLRKRYSFSPVFTYRTLIFILVWLSMISISLIAGNYSLLAILASSRTYLLIIITFLFFSMDNNVSLDDVMYISLGATLGWFLSSIYDISNYLAGNSMVISRTGNLLAIPLLIGIAIYRKNYKILIIGIVLCVAVSLTAGMRRQIVVFLVSLFLSYIFMSMGSVKRFVKQSAIFVLLIAVFILFLPQIEHSLKKNIPILYYRVVVKTEKLLSGKTGSTGDDIRVNEIGNLKKEIKDFILPHGFVSRRTEMDATGRFIDFPLSELFYTFGAVFTLTLLTFIFFITFCCFYYSLHGYKDGIIFVIISIIMIMLLFLEGTFLSSTYVAPFTGYCLGRLKYFSRISFKGNFKTNTNFING
jgi:hypothetical protein